MNGVQESMSRRAFVAGGAAALAAMATAGRRVAHATGGSGLRAGAAEETATPAAEGTFLIGPMKPSTSVHDDLWARALVLDDGHTRAAIITLDYLGFDIATTEELIRAAGEAGGVPADHILLNCSHTHSAPLTAPWGPWKEHRDAPFFDMLPEKVARVAEAAAGSLRPATLRYAKAPVQIGFNRRLLHGDRIVMAPNPSGAVVPRVDVLRVEGADERPIALLFSHAAHPVIVHGASTLISGDYPGFAVSHLRRHAGGAPCLFAQGCSGNINAFPLRGGIDAAKAAGRELADAARRALEEPLPIASGVPLRVRSLELELPLQDPPPLAELRRRHAEERRAERKERFAELLRIAEREERPVMRFPMRAIAFGESLCLLGLSHEPFAEYHHYALRRSPFRHNMVFGYTNGLECYAGTEEAYRLGDRGGYETSPRGAAFLFQSRLPLLPKAEALIRQGVGKLLDTVRQA